MAAEWITHFIEADFDDSDVEIEPVNMAGPEPPKISVADKAAHSATMAKVIRSILDDTFYNIIHDIVAKVHREEKIARMKSAVVVAKQLAEEAAVQAQELETEPNGASSQAIQKERKPIQVETEAAIYEDGAVNLKGNPLKTIKEIICPTCRLPRLLHPLTGVGARPPPDPSKEYCRKHPPVLLDGHDVQGIPFATDKPPTKKKKTQKIETPGSSPPSSPSTQAQVIEKPTIPSIKCPNCPRYYQATKFGGHLARCLGIAQRESVRESNRRRGQNDASNNASSQSPGAGQHSDDDNDDDDEDDDEDDQPPRKKQKSSQANGIKKSSGKPQISSALKNETTVDALEAPASVPTSGVNGTSQTGKNKRKRDDTKTGKAKR
ncbi:hypothetical protein AJ80_01901 [Polytolypa hystricis UAMH7299]|uniref:SAGA-associated factor 11 n=1 Tax=Polytolypa hystricis (strain UAMH7299) TaxID=1447883 RepID=A0A2B7YZL2_POLH7|nr:hypothetical protein AJ80_01901 [Polytolypa hystricis UAMH7299]